MADRDQDRQLNVLSSEEREALTRFLSFPEEFPEAFWSGVIEKASIDRGSIPVSSVNGITQYRPRISRADAAFSSTAYVDLGLDEVKVAKGRYLVQFGWVAPSNDSSPTVELYVQPQLNDETLDDDEALITVRGVDAGMGLGDATSRVSYKTSIKVITVPEQGGTIRLMGKGGSGTNWVVTGVWMQVTEIGAT